MEKNVIVTDEFGRKISSTYPKRARGLIKTGRAELISEHEIRLIGSCPPHISEDNIMSDNIILQQSEETTRRENKAVKHKLYFNSREWRFNPNCPTNVGERTMITDMNGEIKEAWCIGNWSKSLTEIQTENLSLPKFTDFTFVFWLNGGENDRFEEICQLQVLFDDDYENRYTYKLNRNTIRPAKCHKGWALFEIPFTTGNNTYTRLKFVVEDAHTAILPALDKEAYELLPNEKTNPKIPQRHNIVFEDGYPQNAPWSHHVFGDRLTQKAKTVLGNIGETAGETASKAGKLAGETAEKAGKLAGEAAAFAQKAIERAGEKVKDLKHSAVNSEFARTHFYSDIDFDSFNNGETNDAEINADVEITIEDESSNIEAENSKLREEIEELRKLQAEIAERITKLQQ